jgi:hypothetical protein
MRTVRLVATFSVGAALLIGASGCAGGGSQASNTEGQATEASEETTTEAGPKPITPAEKRWYRALNRYANRFHQQAFRGGAVTHLSMQRDSHLARGCRKQLVRRAHPGRFHPAAKLAKRACRRLDKAARLLAKAIAVSGPGGTVEAGTAEEQFSLAFDGASEAMGNADYDLQLAQDKAREIAVELPGG